MGTTQQQQHNNNNTTTQQQQHNNNNNSNNNNSNNNNNNNNNSNNNNENENENNVNEKIDITTIYTKMQVCGTPYYCAPEATKKKKFNPYYADIWSLGILLFVLLTGTWPFDGDDYDEIKQNAINGNV